MSDKEPTQNQQVVENATEPKPEQAELEQKPQDEQQQLTLQSVVEAILFAAEEPLDLESIQERLQSRANIIKTLESLQKQYEKRGINLARSVNILIHYRLMDLFSLIIIVVPLLLIYLRGQLPERIINYLFSYFAI